MHGRSNKWREIRSNRRNIQSYQRLLKVLKDWSSLRLDPSLLEFHLQRKFFPSVNVITQPTPNARTQQRFPLR